MSKISRLTPLAAMLQAGFIAREHWSMLKPADRLLLRRLIVKSKGQPKNLTVKERSHVRRIVSELDPKGAVFKLAPVGRKLSGRR